MTVLPALRWPVEGVSVKRRDGRCCGVDLRAALGETREREVGGIAGAVGDGCGIEIDGGGGERRGVLAGSHGVAEGEGIAAGTARIGGGTAIIESEHGRAAGNRNHLAHVQLEYNGVANVEIVARR